MRSVNLGRPFLRFEASDGLSLLFATRFGLSSGRALGRFGAFGSLSGLAVWLFGSFVLLYLIELQRDRQLESYLLRRRHYRIRRRHRSRFLLHECGHGCDVRG